MLIPNPSAILVTVWIDGFVITFDSILVSVV